MAGGQRRLLTPDFVDSAAIPEIGEAWIADTKVRGFGLRVWASQQGGGKAYAIRIADRGGRMVRRTYAHPDWAPPNALGSILEQARSWARDEINDLKGRQSVWEELKANQKWVRNVVASRSFEALASAKIQGMQHYGADQNYIDNLEKLFFNVIPKDIRAKPIKTISARRLAAALRQLDDKPGQARALRSFVGQLLKSAGEFDRAALRLLDKSQRLYKPDYEWRRVSKIDRRYSKSFFDRLVQRLRAEDRYWQQAIFIRLLFEFEVPAATSLRAQWCNFDDEFWLPRFSEAKDFKALRRRRVNERVKILLKELKNRNDVVFPDNPFLFPSLKSTSGHLVSFRPFWRKIAIEMGVEPKRLRILVRTYQHVILLPEIWMRALADFRPNA
jgi:hypothetical protein